jgi:hypothetical protein
MSEWQPISTAPKDGTKKMAEIPIDFAATHRQETDGSHTVIVTVSGLPSMAVSNKIAMWMRHMIRSNANEIGRLEKNPPSSH